MKHHTLGALFGEPTVDMSKGPTLDAARQVQTEANPSLPPEGASRAAGQRRQILDALRRGRVNVAELKAIACQYNARIYELRHAGYVITNVEQNKTTGESWYELRSSPKHVGDGVFHVEGEP